MKIPYKMAAVLAGASLLLSSCAVDGFYGSFGVAGPGYNASVAWSNASYDANGFPIFGYSYGQPVYGYTPSGAAVLSFAALTALCFVPQWGPAPWYRGSWHYPPRIHRVSAPPRYPSGHRPHERPQGGMNAPIHHNPGSASHAGRPSYPGAPGHRGPGANMPGRPTTPNTRPSDHGYRGPGANMPGRPTTPNTRPSGPGAGWPTRPTTSGSRPSNSNSHIVRPGSSTPGTRPSNSNSHIVRPGSSTPGTRPSNSASHVARPGSSTPGTRPSNSASHVARPSSSTSGTRPSNSNSHVSRPGSGGTGFPSHGGFRGGPRH